MPLSGISLANHLVGTIIGSILTGLGAFGRSLWIKRHPLIIDPKVHQSNGGRWTSNHNLLLRNRSNVTCHDIWLMATTDNPTYDFMDFKIEEAQEYSPYSQAFILRDVAVTADFTQILRRVSDNKIFKIMRIAMVLPGDQRLFRIEASKAAKNQQFQFQIIEWSREPIQILTEPGRVALKVSLPARLGAQGEEFKIMAQGIVAKRTS